VGLQPFQVETAQGGHHAFVAFVCLAQGQHGRHRGVDQLDHHAAQARHIADRAVVGEVQRLGP